MRGSFTAEVDFGKCKSLWIFLGLIVLVALLFVELKLKDLTRHGTDIEIKGPVGSWFKIVVVMGILASSQTDTYGRYVVALTV